MPVLVSRSDTTSVPAGSGVSCGCGFWIAPATSDRSSIRFEDRLARVREDVVLDVVVVVHPGQQAGLLVVLAQLAGIDPGLDHPILAGVVGRLQEEVPRRGRIAAGVDVAVDRRDVEVAVLDGVEVRLLADDVVPARPVEGSGLEVVAEALADARITCGCSPLSRK